MFRMKNFLYGLLISLFLLVTVFTVHGLNATWGQVRINDATAVALIRQSFTSHYTTSPEIVEQVLTVLSQPSGVLTWEDVQDLNQEAPNKEVTTLGEVWVIQGEAVNAYTFFAYVEGSDYGCYVWTRYSTQWKRRTANAEPMPHSDDIVRTYECTDVLTVFKLLDDEMRNK